ATGPRAETWKPIVRLADLDGDGRLDLLVANGRRGNATLLAGDGRGGFGPARSFPLLGPAEPGRFSLSTGDVDGDGHLDLVVARSADADPGAGSLWTLRGDGKGGFGERLGAVQPVLPRPGLEALADADGDGDLDVVLSHGGRSALSVLLHRGGGVFEPATGSPYDPGAPAFATVVSDVDGDGRADLVVATVFGHAPFASRVAVLLGDGRGFAPAPGSPFIAGPGAYRVAVGDVDGDGRADLAASCFEGDGVTLLLGRSLAARGR
ncbi:MAG TPA: VCBS repeat-containing protein, partial [Planctomycetota bacterium]|nr:VCBS repeat-containing protein [Planctomycetota bacterium]